MKKRLLSVALAVAMDWGGREMDEMIKRVMDICVDALRCEDLEVYGYSESYQRFTVKTSKGDIRIDFDEED